MKKILPAGLGLTLAALILWKLFSVHPEPNVPVRPSTSSPARLSDSKPGRAGPTEDRKISLRFSAPSVANASEPAQVTLILQRNPQGPSEKIPSTGRVEFLLRLPAGVKLHGEGWTSAALPPEEREDSSGPWRLFQREESLLPRTPLAPDAPQILAQVPASLSVDEEGTNWVITARARLSQAAETWQTFGGIFATRQGDRIEFHTQPKAALEDGWPR